MKIREKYCDTGAYEIWLDCVGLDEKTMSYCSKITKHFSKGKYEFFFGLFRTDGINLTSNEWERYNKEIPHFFKSNGKYESITKNIPKKREGLLTVASAPANNQMYEMLPKVFHYHLETTYFSPKIDWKTFTQAYSDYMKDGAHGYVMKGYTDFMFSYVDSGDFFIEFNPNNYDVDIVYREVEQIIWG